MIELAQIWKRILNLHAKRFGSDLQREGG